MSPNLERLGRWVVGRRVELGFGTREAFAQTSKISSRLLSDLENARRPSYAPSTVVKLEQALHWTPGSVDAVLTGGEPEPASAERTPGDDYAVSAADSGRVMTDWLQVGSAVASNVRAVRSARRLPVREMSARLGAIGCRLLPSGITKIEHGARKVSVEELAAIAAVLDVAEPWSLVAARICATCHGAPPRRLRCLDCGAGGSS